jgi:hypothetical protein
MLNHDLNDDSNFDVHLPGAQLGANGQTVLAISDPQWLEYWNDADSIAANLRKVDHWLQRAAKQSA